MSNVFFLIILALCGFFVLAAIIYLVATVIELLLFKVESWRCRRMVRVRRAQEKPRPKVTADSPRDVRLNEFVHELGEDVRDYLHGDFGMVQWVSPPPYVDDRPGNQLWHKVCVGLAAQIDMPVRWNGFDIEKGIERLKKIALPLAKKYDLLNDGQLDIRATKFNIGWRAHLHSMVFPIAMIKVEFTPERILRCKKIEACEGLASVVLKDYFSHPLEEVLKRLLRQTADSMIRFRGDKDFDKLMETPVFGRAEDGRGASKRGWPVVDAYQNSPSHVLDDLYWD